MWAGDALFLRLMEEDAPFFSLKLRYEGERLAYAALNGAPLDVEAETGKHEGGRMDNTESADKKVLLFGFEDLRSILAVQAALEPFHAELIPVAKTDYGKTLSVLAGLEDEASSDHDAQPVGGAIPGHMAVLCGLDEDLDALLPALSGAGAGETCLKAVLTRHNRAWSATKLYMELSRERAAMRP